MGSPGASLQQTVDTLEAIVTKLEKTGTTLEGVLPKIPHMSSNSTHNFAKAPFIHYILYITIIAIIHRTKSLGMIDVFDNQRSDIIMINEDGNKRQADRNANKDLEERASTQTSPTQMKTEIPS